MSVQFPQKSLEFSKVDWLLPAIDPDISVLLYVNIMEVMDSYEQNLLTLFESCDDYYQGTLSAAGLHELCEKLKLQDSCSKLTQYLIGDFKSKRILFHEFKDGLLKLLNGLDSEDKCDGKLSPGREIPPKYVYGKKKYGRRSRPENSDTDGLLSDDSSGIQENPILCISTDDNSSDELVPKKRRTRGSKTRERKSLDKSGENESLFDNQETPPVLTNAMNEVEHLVTAWSSISRGVTDSLSKGELIKVFKCMGLETDSEEAAERMFEKLELEENGRITLGELLELIRSNGNWSKETRNQQMELEATQKNVSLELIEPVSLGSVTGARLIEHWECAGVPGASQLLQNLGYSSSQQINLASIVLLLSDEIKNLTDEIKTRQVLDPLIVMLRANSVLQNLYIQSLKSTIEHVNAEKEKLRNDVFEANQRALLLAQEVDDHHSKLEHSTQQQVKILEQKHAEKIRELIYQANLEQDALLAQQSVLEKKIKAMEEDEVKNKAVISQLELEGRLLEQEHSNMANKLAGIQRTKSKLEQDLQNMSVLQQRVSEMESVLNENDVTSLLERIRTLEIENTNLRDCNDELSIEVEKLSAKLSNTTLKKQSGNSAVVNQAVEENISGGAVKRRGDSFTFIESAEESGGEEGSPRLGKVRKCSAAKDFVETASSLKELQIRSDGHGGCIEDESYSEPNFGSHKSVSETWNENSCKIVPFSEELEQAGKISVPASFTHEDWREEVKNKLQKIYGNLERTDKTLGDELIATFKKILDRNSKKNIEAEESLKARCKELETSLELLREEYEKTEDYWSEKLEEERGFFEEEQKLSDKKYSELLEKILEYEEMLNAEREQRQRLETIEEKESFEKQVADMEQECADLRSKLAEVVKEKKIETERLKSEIEKSKVSRVGVHCGVQVSDSDSEKEKHSWKNHNEENDKISCRQCDDMKNLFEIKLKFQREVDFLKKQREQLRQELTEQKSMFTNYEGNGKVQQLEQKCRTLTITLRRQQKQTEDILKNTWKQHKEEVKDLKSVLRMTEEKLKRQTRVIQEQLTKLAKTDFLVKDLFVENAYLISSVQKLEKQCQSCENNKTSL